MENLAPTIEIDKKKITASTLLGGALVVAVTVISGGQIISYTTAMKVIEGLTLGAVTGALPDSIGGSGAVKIKKKDPIPSIDR
jgi:hypothetical protein